MESNMRERVSGDLVAKKVKLIDIVDYQKAAVVSRTIIDKEAGTVDVPQAELGGSRVG
jgi:hypothetical protein